MQRWYSRLAGIPRLACLDGQTRLSLSPYKLYNPAGSIYGPQQQRQQQHGLRRFSLSSVQWARSKARRASLLREGQEDIGRHALFPESKLPPSKDRSRPEAWVTLLNRVLPARLQSESTVQTDQDTARDNGLASLPALSPRDVAVILHRAQRNYGLDILTYLGVERGRWKAVVWLVTRIVDKLWEEDLGKIKTRVHTVLPTNTVWQGEKDSLQSITEDKFFVPKAPNQVQNGDMYSLDSLSGNRSPLRDHLPAVITHELLGTIWSSLGNMIIADAASKDKVTNKAITPEILEIIAWLHHKGMMPSSIYSYQPSEDLSALRQPPTLHLLSSHIMTSLSDAAWRAHESRVVEEANAKGGEYLALRPEIPGSMYNIHVAGLGHEVWLELVLWSCLHGEWTDDGASILQNVARSESWSALSWRELAAPLVHPGQEKSINWDDLSYRLNAGSVYGDPSITNAAKARVKRTLSVEIIAAFVDSLLNSVRTSVGSRGVPAGRVLQYFTQFKAFLDRNSLSLGSTSWDVVVLRFFESQGVDIQQDPGLAERIAHLLSSQFGKELSASNAPVRNQPRQPLPLYALEGTAISIGKMHRVLSAYVEQDNQSGALRAFEHLQALADRNKQKSIQHFFTRQMSEMHDLDEHDEAKEEFSFDNRFVGIEYPGFYPQLPATILAPFLDLITETRSFTFAKWLLESEDIDGPIIPKSMYTDPVMGPSLVRYASAVGDSQFLIKLLDQQGTGKRSDVKLPRASLAALLHGQVQLKKWDSVDTVLEAMRESGGYQDGVTSVAIIARAILYETDPAKGPSTNADAQPGLNRAFAAMLRMANDARSLDPLLYRRVCTTLKVLSCIDQRWEDFLGQSKHIVGSHKYFMKAASFKTILEGVVSTYGSEKGKAFLGRFWSAAAQDDITHPAPVNRSADQSKFDGETGVRRMPTDRLDAQYPPWETWFGIT